MSIPERIPVYLLSGFLGSGKSTLLNQFLDDPSFHDTAVIINEFGDIPVDHLLVREGDTTISQVSTGCLCCSGSSDIRTTLLDLYYAASCNSSVSFSRVIVEMSGLGDPAPLVNALCTNHNDEIGLHHGTAEDAFYLAGFVTLFDVISGASSLENHFEALKQVAFADRIVLTKTDLVKENSAQTDIDALLRGLREINASADIVDRQETVLPALFSPRPYSVVDRCEDVTGWLALEAALASEASHHSLTKKDDVVDRHGSGVRTFSIVADTPLPERRVQQFLTTLRSSAGSHLLRVKGIISTEETPERPLIVHAVQHVITDPVRLDAWPDDDRRTRLVFITSGIDPKPVRQLFAATINATPFSLTKSIKHLGSKLANSFASSFSMLSNLSRRSQ